MSDVRMFVVPAPGKRFTNPATGRPLKAAGEFVAPSLFWHRRLRDGDVTQGSPPPEPQKKPASRAPKPPDAAA